MHRRILSCSLLYLTPLVVLLFVPGSPVAQVLQTSRYATVLSHARALTAGSTASDVAHHIHYDLKFRDRHGHEFTATYDIYRDPPRQTRVDIVAGDYRYTHIRDLMNKRDWKHFSGDMPLKIFDLRDVLIEPKPEIYRLEQSQPPPAVRPEMIDGSPFACASNQVSVRVCFDPLIRTFAFAQVFNQTVTYDDWQRIGTHAIPGKISLYDGKKPLVEATGKVETVRKFPPLLFVPGDEPTQSEDEDHRLIRFKPQPDFPFYGNVQLQISVNEKGKVTKTKLIDSDNHHLDEVATSYARSFRFAPENANGQPSSFTSVFYLHYFPEE